MVSASSLFRIRIHNIRFPPDTPLNTKVPIYLLYKRTLELNKFEGVIIFSSKVIVST